MRYILATHNDKVQWYAFDPKNTRPGEFALLNELDVSKVPNAGNKETAKEWAKSLGLKTWRYFSY